MHMDMGCRSYGRVAKECSILAIAGRILVHRNQIHKEQWLVK